MKLLWNTNKNLPKNPLNLSEERSVFWGNYHFDNSPWILNLLSKLKIEMIDDIKYLDQNESLIIVDDNISIKDSFYFDLSAKAKKIYLIHLGDEGGTDKKDLVYSLCEHVWRTFSLPMFDNYKNVTSIPIGYKSEPLKKNIEISKKKYLWSFLGTTHGSSRYDLLDKHENLKPNFINLTADFSGKNSMNTEDYYDILNDSIFAPVPHGYFHPESYRLYEALEIGCIPILENPFNYFDKFLPNNPIPNINNWKDSSDFIKNYIGHHNEIEILRKKIQDWWIQHKENIKKSFSIINDV